MMGQELFLLELKAQIVVVFWEKDVWINFIMDQFKNTKLDWLGLNVIALTFTWDFLIELTLSLVYQRIWINN